MRHTPADGATRQHAPAFVKDFRQIDGALLHDGRAPTIDAAIRLHDGEAATVRDRYTRLNSAQQRQLLDFLKSI